MASVSPNRFFLFLSLVFILFLVEKYIARVIEKESWLGYGVVEQNMSYFTTKDFIWSIDQFDIPTRRLYALYEFIDLFFCFAYAIFLSDVTAVSLNYLNISDKSILRWIDILPFILAAVDFLENFALILTLCFYPLLGPTKVFLLFASSLSYAKYYTFLGVGSIVVLFCILGGIGYVIKSTTKKPTKSTEKKVKSQ